MEDHTQLLVRTSQLYYEEELSQSEIANILQISRPTVSRLIDEAKREGIVEIIVHDPIQKNTELSKQLRNSLHLKDVIILRGTYNYDKALKRCCEAGIQLLSAVLKNGQTIGIAWGSVPQLISNMLEPKDYYNITVVQMVGCLGTGNPNIDGLELAIQLSKKLAGTYSNIYAPIYVKSPFVRDYLVAEPQIATALKKAMHTDIILTGIGTFDSATSIQRAGYWSDEDRLELQSLGAVGHLLGRPFDQDGNPIERPGHFIIGAPLIAMRGTPWSIGIGVGNGKAKATLGAIRGGYINTLIGDEELAISLLELLKNSK